MIIGMQTKTVKVLMMIYRMRHSGSVLGCCVCSSHSQTVQHINNMLIFVWMNNAPQFPTAPSMNTDFFFFFIILVFLHAFINE